MCNDIAMAFVTDALCRALHGFAGYGHMMRIGMYQGICIAHHCHVALPKEQIAALKRCGIWQGGAKGGLLQIAVTGHQSSAGA